MITGQSPAIDIALINGVPTFIAESHPVRCLGRISGELVALYRDEKPIVLRATGGVEETVTAHIPGTDGQ